MQVHSLHVYPFKAAAGWSPQTAKVCETGLEQDRRFVLVDSAGRFVSQRTLPALTHLRIELGEGVRLHHQQRSIHLPHAEGELVTIEVWGDRVVAQDWGPAIGAFLTAEFGQALRLCEAIPQATRWVNERYTAGEAVPYFFADGFPILVISQESLDHLNERLREKGLTNVEMDRFRPNIVIKGWKPHGEDEVQRIRIGQQLELVLAKPCSRCSVITIDQSTGLSSQEPLQTLASYRKGPEGGKIYFGQNAYVARGVGSTIALGDEVEVLA
jgi:uncharacterized protein YcbX